MLTFRQLKIDDADDTMCAFSQIEMSSFLTFMWKSVRCDGKTVEKWRPTTRKHWLVWFEDDTWVVGGLAGWIRFSNSNGKTTGSQNIYPNRRTFARCVCVCKHPKTFIKGEKFAMAEKRNGNVICEWENVSEMIVCKVDVKWARNKIFSA